MAALVILSEGCTLNVLKACFQSSGALGVPHYKCFAFAKNLGLEEEEIEKLETDLFYEDIGLIDVYVSILKGFKQMNGINATLHILISTLEESGYKTTAGKLQERFNVPMDKDKLNLAKSKAHSNNPDVLGHMRNNIVKNIWQLVDSTTVNGKLEEKLRGSGLLTEDAFNEMISTEDANAKSIIIYNHVLQNSGTSELTWKLIEILLEAEQHTAIRLLVKIFLKKQHNYTGHAVT